MLRQLLFPAFFVTMLIPLAWWTGYYATSDYLLETRIWQIVAAVIASIMAMVYIRHVRAVAWWPMALFVGLATISTVWSEDGYDTLLRALVLGVYLTGLIGFLNTSDSSRSIPLAVLVIAAGMAILAILLGPSARTFGGITPNLIGHFAFTAMVLLSMMNRLKWWALAIILGLLFYTQARTVLIASATFLLFRYAVFPAADAAKSRLLPLGIAALGMAFVIVLAPVIMSIIPDVSELLGITSQSRLDGSLTGRTAYWTAGLDVFEQTPLLGYGFDTRGTLDTEWGARMNAHSGMVNLLLDLGVIGATLFTLWFLSALWRSVAVMEGETAKTNAAALFGFVPMLVSEPNYISLYHPSSYLLLLCLCLPSVRRLIPDQRQLMMQPTHRRLNLGIAR